MVAAAIAAGRWGRAAEPAHAAAANHFSIGDFGAVGDGKTTNTQAFARAIAACAEKGGGQVEVPAGTYLTGPIVLKSNIDLHVDAGAIVLFSKNFKDYPLVFAGYEGRDTVMCQSPISGDNLHDVTISGEGAFDGQGQAWRPAKRAKFSADLWDKLVHSGGVVDASGNTWWPSAAAMNGGAALMRLRSSGQPLRISDYEPYHDLLRPSLLLLSNCKHVTLTGATFRNSPNWNLHLLLSDDLTVRGITLFNPAYAQNGDGIDFDSCRNVLMTGCNVNAGDDDICLKSGRDAEGRKLNRPTENVTITHCTIGTGHGGIAIGSEMSGGVRNVTVSDCTMNGTEGGLRFKTTRGRGGVVENINISNIRMSNIIKEAIGFNMYYMIKGAKEQLKPVDETTPQFRNFHISDIQCSGAQFAIQMHGLPEMPITDITLSDANLTAQEGGSIIDGKNITLRNVHVNAGSPVTLKNVQGLKMEDCSGIEKP